MLTGGCHCGAVQYELDPSELRHSSLCHCTDCRRHAGAPMVAWACVPRAAVSIIGEPAEYRSSEHGRRHFCGHCGTSLFYANAVVLPGMFDIQTATLDNPDALPPTGHVQVAEQIGWMAAAHELPMDARYG